MSNRKTPDEIPGLRGLKLEQMPERDLWPGIASRLPPRRSRVQRWIGYAMAASLVGALAIGVLRQAPPDSLPVPAETALATPAFAAPQETRVAGHVNPQRQALLKANLAIVKDAEGQLKQALEQDPDSAALRRLLLAMKQQRGDLKAQLAQDPHAQNI